MMRKHESQLSVLCAPQIGFQPARLDLPEGVAFLLGGARTLDIAVDDGEVRAAPVERVVRPGAQKIEITGSAVFVVAQGRIERGLAQQLTLDTKEDRPQSRVIAVVSQVSGMNDEIGLRVPEDGGNDIAMHLVARASVAVDHELKARLAGGRRFERSLPRPAGKGLIGVSRARLETR